MPTDFPMCLNGLLSNVYNNMTVVVEPLTVRFAKAVLQDVDAGFGVNANFGVDVRSGFRVRRLNVVASGVY